MLEKQKGIKIKRIRIPLIPENDEEILVQSSEELEALNLSDKDKNRMKIF